MNVPAAYYNENDPFCVQWLRNLIEAGHIPAGDVDDRSIVDVQPSDLIGYTQCHFFAGIGGWAYAARLAGWPDDRELWTGSCPCQPFSVAGKGRGKDDERHLWPHQFRLIRAMRPAVWMGEQVAAAVGKDWLDGVCADLEGIGYACGASVIPACAVNAPHRRDRAWIVADASRKLQHRSRNERQGWRRESANGCGMGDSDCTGLEGRPALHERGSERIAGTASVADADQSCACEERQQRSGQFGRTGCDPWAHHSWITGHDGKARRVEPGIRLLAHGVPARVGKLRAYGNAIVPQVAAEVIGAYMEAA